MATDDGTGRAARTSRRSLLAACCAALGAGCTALSDDADDEYPPLDGRSEGWTTYRGSLAATGRARTTLSGPYEVDRLWEYQETDLTPVAWDTIASTTTPGVVATRDAVVATTAEGEHVPIAVRRDGQGLRWTLDDVLQTELPPGAYWRTAMPVAAGGDVFVHTRYRLDRIADGGELVWTDDTGLGYSDRLIGDRSELYRTGSIARIDPVSGADRGVERFRSTGRVRGVSVADGRAAVSMTTNYRPTGIVAGFDTDDWSVDWTRRLSDPLWSAPSLHDGRAHVVSTPRAAPPEAADERGTVRAYDLVDGSLLWSEPEPLARVGVSLDEDGTAYVPHDGSGLLAFDAADGTRLWSAAVDRPFTDLVGDPEHAHPPIVTDDAVVLAGVGGLAILDRADGSLRWETDRTLMGAPAVAFGDVYAVTSEGLVAVRGG